MLDIQLDFKSIYVNLEDQNTYVVLKNIFNEKEQIQILVPSAYADKLFEISPDNTTYYEVPYYESFFSSITLLKCSARFINVEKIDNSFHFTMVLDAFREDRLIELPITIAQVFLLYKYFSFDIFCSSETMKNAKRYDGDIENSHAASHDMFTTLGHLYTEDPGLRELFPSGIKEWFTSHSLKNYSSSLLKLYDIYSNKISSLNTRNKYQLPQCYEDFFNKFDNE